MELLYWFYSRLCYFREEVLNKRSHNMAYENRVLTTNKLHVIKIKWTTLVLITIVYLCNMTNISNDVFFSLDVYFCSVLCLLTLLYCWRPHVLKIRHSFYVCGLIEIPSLISLLLLSSVFPQNQTRELQKAYMQIYLIMLFAYHNYSSIRATKWQKCGPRSDGT